MKAKGFCLFYEGITYCERCCSDCLEVCPLRCKSSKKNCGGYTGYSDRYWGVGEEKQLINLRICGFSWEQLAKILGRSETSCKKKHDQIKKNEQLH